MELEEMETFQILPTPIPLIPLMTLIYRSYDSDYNSLISDYTSLKAAH